MSKDNIPYHNSCSHGKWYFQDLFDCYWAFYQIAKSREKGGRKLKNRDQANKLPVLSFQVVHHQAKKLEVQKTKTPEQMEYSKAH